MKKKRLATCPCCSGKTYKKCCQPYHDGTAPPTAEALMRSRYSAYAMHLPAYIIESTHPQNTLYQTNTKEWKEELLSFCQSVSFTKLEVLATEEGETSAVVSFRAHFSQDDRRSHFTEKSLFKKVLGRWLYHEGQVLSE